MVLLRVETLPISLGGIEVRHEASKVTYSVEVVPDCTCHLIDDILSCAFINS